MKMKGTSKSKKDANKARIVLTPKVNNGHKINKQQRAVLMYDYMEVFCLILGPTLTSSVIASPHLYLFLSRFFLLFFIIISSIMYHKL